LVFDQARKVDAEADEHVVVGVVGFVVVGAATALAQHPLSHSVGQGRPMRGKGRDGRAHLALQGQVDCFFLVGVVGVVVLT
jgi:hypothetical protein